MICGTGLDLLQSSGKYPCAVCRTGVGNNSIYCNGCKLWVHKKCSRLQRLTPNPDYRCAWEMAALLTADLRVKSRSEVVASFCYLDGMLSAGGGCEITVTTHVKTARKKFRELPGSYQGATSSDIPPPLLQDPWPCIQLLRAERHAPGQ